MTTTREIADQRPRSPGDDVVALLSDPKSYAEHPAGVTQVETHISRVFLTDRHAYKLKKPVRFDFLDFSTAALRHEACLAEVQLNRRLAADVYLGVVPVTRYRSGRLKLGGSGEPVDWVVKMRRLPDPCRLDHMIRGGTLRDAAIAQIAGKLAEFYRQLPPLSIRTDTYRQHLEEHVQANRRELLDPAHELDAALVERVHAAQLLVLRLCPGMFDERVCDGRIVEGHGDLRPEHIYLSASSAPTIIDCIEFNPEFRQLDVLDELSFFAMECAYLGANEVGGRILEQYCRTSGDRPPARLVPFYMCYRACVHAKVWALRGRQDRAAAGTGFAQSRAYAALADRYAAELGPPVLLIVRGLSGAGKSTLAAALGESLRISRLQTDAVRRELFGEGDGQEAFNAGRYCPENRQRVYDEMLRRAGQLLGDRRSVVLDGTFLTSRSRSQAVLLARRHGAVPLLIECRCPEDVAAERITARAAAGDGQSDARPEFLRRQRELEEADPPGLLPCRVDTSLSPPALLEKIYQRLHALLESPAS